MIKEIKTQAKQSEKIVWPTIEGYNMNFGVIFDFIILSGKWNHMQYKTAWQCQTQSYSIDHNVEQFAHSGAGHTNPQVNAATF